MDLLRNLMQKTTASGLNFKPDKGKLKFPAGSIRQDTRQRPESIEEIQKNVKDLLAKFPGSPEFLGENIEYKKRNRRLFFIFKLSPPNLSELRDIVNRFSESKEVLDPRPKIKKLMKRFPAEPDVRALNGIQIFNDCKQSGLDTKKLDAMEVALKEIAGALHNGGFSIFNASWFVRIYIRYLELLKDRLTAEYNTLRDSSSTEIRTAAEKLNRAILQTTTMMSIRDKMGGLAMLNAKLKGSVYISSIITNEEIRSAANASLQNDMTRQVGHGKTANYVILVTLTLGLLIARVPIFKRLVSDILAAIPDTTKNLILQKNMIATMVIVTDFQLSLSSGDIEKSREIAERLFNRCKTVIEQHLEYSILKKPHEVDPFLKAAWIAKESHGLISESEYRERLEEAQKYLQVVTGNQGKVKGAFELARQLQNDIDFICAEYGWSTG